MAVRLRLQRHGRKGHPVYHIVAASAQAARDGRFIEKLGYYDPTLDPAVLEVNRDRALQWLHDGAKPTPTVRRLLSTAGVLYYKHLQRGIALGVLTQELADEKWNKWLEARRNASGKSNARSRKRRKKDKKQAAPAS
ncbi:MAG: 30S ribosomal protein S16 [Chitinophagales bacterium]|nr:30S ribosomal protein S16 [Chitinophagales bacterium]MDW8394392.1 30S ribosomal protein S16 [Chitinophagales bacterium]